ncbi:MAG: transcriptional regulator [Pseudomonadaceae bacterium]|nr:transcriptional regulator [Pseudomonadaceae bacterium]
MADQDNTDSSAALAQPKCPDCSVSGSEHIISTPSTERSRAKQPWFYIIHCDTCGHVYNTLSKHSFTQAVTPNFVLPKPS